MENELLFPQQNNVVLNAPAMRSLPFNWYAPHSRGIQNNIILLWKQKPIIWTVHSRTGGPRNIIVIRYQNVRHCPTVHWSFCTVTGGIYQVNTEVKEYRFSGVYFQKSFRTIDKFCKEYFCLENWSIPVDFVPIYEVHKNIQLQIFRSFFMSALVLLTLTVTSPVLQQRELQSEQPRYL